MQVNSPARVDENQLKSSTREQVEFTQGEWFSIFHFKSCTWNSKRSQLKIIGLLVMFSKSTNFKLPCQLEKYVLQNKTVGLAKYFNQNKKTTLQIKNNYNNHTDLRNNNDI